MAKRPENRPQTASEVWQCVEIGLKEASFPVEHCDPGAKQVVCPLDPQAQVVEEHLPQMLAHTKPARSRAYFSPLNLGITAAVLCATSLLVCFLGGNASLLVADIPVRNLPPAQPQVDLAKNNSPPKPLPQVEPRPQPPVALSQGRLSFVDTFDKTQTPPKQRITWNCGPHAKFSLQNAHDPGSGKALLFQPKAKYRYLYGSFSSVTLPVGHQLRLDVSLSFAGSSGSLPNEIRGLAFGLCRKNTDHGYYGNLSTGSQSAAWVYEDNEIGTTPGSGASDGDFTTFLKPSTTTGKFDGIQQGDNLQLSLTIAHQAPQTGYVLMSILDDQQSFTCRSPLSTPLVPEFSRIIISNLAHDQSFWIDNVELICEPIVDEPVSTGK